MWVLAVGVGIEASSNEFSDVPLEKRPTEALLQEGEVLGHAGWQNRSCDITEGLGSVWCPKSLFSGQLSGQ